jgi:hypothetical protein
MEAALLGRLERVPIINPPIADNSRHATVSVLGHLFAHLNTNNINHCNNTKLLIFLEIVDFSVSCWFCVLYKKVKFLHPEEPIVIKLIVSC